MKLKKCGYIAAAVCGFFVAVWLVPPILHTAKRLCPVRPDGVSEADAMPQFARKHGINCSVCHTTVPELTRAGYEFRRAGFRMPDEIGKDTKFEGLKDMYSARVREEFRLTGKATDNAFVFHELTFYPITGAIGKWWAAETELTFAPGEKPEVENAYIRATYPHKDWLFTARAGILHPFEGYGASDRPISNIRPQFQSQRAKQGSFDTQVQIWNQDQEGLELGATYKDTTLTMAVLNGFNSETGAANEGDNNNSRDLLFFFNQIIGDNAGVSA